MGRKKCKAERKRHTKNVTSGFCMLVLRVICLSSCFFSVFSKFSKEAWNYFYNHFFFKLPHEWTVYWEIPTAREEMGRCSIDAENEREAKEEECIFLPGQQWVGCWSGVEEAVGEGLHRHRPHRGATGLVHNMLGKHLQSILCIHGDWFQDSLGYQNPRMLESLI